MILVDTNVLSELSRSKPHPSVMAWASTRPRASLAIPFSAIVEIQKGISELMLTDLQRAMKYQKWLEEVLASDMTFLPMGIEEAKILGVMHATPQLRDLWVPTAITAKPKMQQDLAIAATAIARQLPVATRNMRDFTRINKYFPLPALLNPFETDWLAIEERELAYAFSTNPLEPEPPKATSSLN